MAISWEGVLQLVTKLALSTTNLEVEGVAVHGVSDLEKFRVIVSLKGIPNEQI